MTLIKKQQKPDTDRSKPNIFEKMLSTLDEQKKQIAELNSRMDTLIESDKALHKAMEKGEPVKEEPVKEETAKEEVDTTDKKEELEDKIEEV